MKFMVAKYLTAMTDDIKDILQHVIYHRKCMQQ